MFGPAPNKSSVTLANFGGLVTEATPPSLAEGSSPLCYDVDFLVGHVFTRPGLFSVYGTGVNSQNFVWVQTFALQNGQLYTLALDANGDLWQEDVTNVPGTLVQIQTVIPGSAAFGTTAFQRKYLCLSGQSDIPRQWDGTNFDRVSQEGPAAAPNVVTATASNPNLANITAYSVSSDVITFTAINNFTTDELVQVVLPALFGTNTGQILTVASVISSGPSTGFTADFTTADIATTAAVGTATPLTGFPITSITQPAQQTIYEQLLWSGAADAAGAGVNLTVYYSTTTQDAVLVNLFNSGVPVYVYLSGLPAAFPAGTYAVTSIGRSKYSSNNAFYFTVTLNSTQFAKQTGGSLGTYQMTIATVTVSQAMPGAIVGNSVSIQNATPSTWDGTWTIVQAPNSGVFVVTQTSMNSSGLATYVFTLQSGATPVAGDLVTVTNTTNGNGIFNVVNATIFSAAAGSFTVQFPNFSGAITGVAETGQAEVTGNIFEIDPGLFYIGGTNTNSPILGNDSATGTIVVAGQSLNVAAGTRQCVVLFLSRNGCLTKASPPVTFTSSSNTESITVNNIPIGPPDVIARWIAFTEAGANGVPGAFFYVIPNPVNTILNGQSYTYAPTVVNDNVSTSATFSFIDSVLLSSLEIDIPGGNAFAQMELGSTGWCINYAGRMFYGLVQNKVTNFLNMSFNGGYLSTPLSPATQPLGWSKDTVYTAGGSLILSSVFGDAYYIQNTTGVTQTQIGMIFQSAYQDAYNVPILLPNTAYSVRIAARIPSGNISGSVFIDVTTYNQANNTYGPSLGIFTLGFSSMSTVTKVFTGPLVMATAMGTTVPPTLVLRVYGQTMSAGSDIEIDRIEVFPTLTPVLNTALIGSYVNAPEQFDQITGILGVAETNTQALNGGFVMYDQLYLLKGGQGGSSMFSTQDTPGSEPEGWDVHEVSNQVGTCGTNAYDVGEEWCVTACRSGLYVFFGKQPIKISQEIFQVWEAINWAAAGTIWVKNDLVNRRILVGVPMATGPGTASYPWLPNAPALANPTSPNVILMLNYQGLGDVMSLADGQQMHTTMFGTLMSVDMRRKWTIWNIASPNASFVTQADNFTQTLYICNGKASGKIYQLLASQLSDDGAVINSLYTTYGWVDAAKAQANPMLGLHRKLWTYLQMLVSGSGLLQVTILPNNVIPALPFYPVNLSPITLVANPADDYERPLNVSGNRIYVQVSTNAVGAAFALDRIILVGGMATLPIRGSASQ